MLSPPKTILFLSVFLFGMTDHGWASPIVMNLSITDPLQTTVPGSIITYHFQLVNTIGTDLPIAGFANVNPPAYLSEIFDPFTLPANAAVTGTLSFQVASTATSGLQTFETNAYSTLHDPVSGDSYASNFSTLSVDVVSEPSAMLLLAGGLGVLLTLYRRGLKLQLG
jgi:hypothetical protein